jgi:hypothetical protein
MIGGRAGFSPDAVQRGKLAKNFHLRRRVLLT